MIHSFAKRIFLFTEAQESIKEMENPVFDDYRTVEISVHGMTCQSCVKNITSNMQDKDGITKITVSLEKELAVVSYDPTRTSEDQIIQQINDMGFEAVLRNKTVCDVEGDIKVLLLNLKGIDSDIIASKVSNELTKENGIISCDIYENNNLAAVSYRPSVIKPNAIQSHLKKKAIIGTVLSKQSTEKPKDSMETITLHIEGMTCDSCTNSIKTALSKLSGIEEVKISLKEKKAVVKHYPLKIKCEEVRDAIDDIGFDATLLEEGMFETHR